MPSFDPAAVGILVTGLVLGIRHGIDWDHIAAITDITSTAAAAGAAEAAHQEQHRTDLGRPPRPRRPARRSAPTTSDRAPRPSRRSDPRARRQPFLSRHQIEAIRLGTLYALGHGAVVIALGIAALAFGALLPDWLDPIMARIVGVTLVMLGRGCCTRVYRYARAGEPFRLRSRWMLVFDGVRLGWRHLQARIHGHEHVEPLEMSSYGTRTAFGVGMIHGIGAETGTQVLLIAAVGGAASAGLGVPMLFAFVIGLLLSNFAIVLLSSAGFVAEPDARADLRRDRGGRGDLQPRRSGRCSCSGSRAACPTSNRSSRSRPPSQGDDRAPAHRPAGTRSATVCTRRASAGRPSGGSSSTSSRGRPGT